MRYDVIVVGAGPAGSVTAYECARQGISVVLIDRAEFPRDKPCGGGVTIHAADVIPFDISPVVERTAYGVHFTLRKRQGLTRYSARRLVYLTQRCRLDAYMAEQARKAGAVMVERAPVRSVERDRRRVVVRADGRSFEAAALVAADGANGPTARMAGIQVRLVQGIALEGNVTPKGPFPPQWEELMGLNVGDIPGGYGWIFPKGDHLNIGVGGWKYLGPSMRQRLMELVRFYGFDPDQVWGLRGHHLPMRREGSPLAHENVLLVGDAAGLLDPFTGEGIYSAAWSGRAAARALARYLDGQAPDLSEYRREVEQGLLPDLRVARRFADLFHLSPGLYWAIERWSGILWRAIVRLLRGEQTYSGIKAKLGGSWTAVDLLSDAVRVVPFLQRAAGMGERIPPQRFFRRSALR